MKVRAVYNKEVIIVDDATQEELDKVPKEGMPVRFDYMADEIDNEMPLTFQYYKPCDEETTTTEVILHDFSILPYVVYTVVAVLSSLLCVSISFIVNKHIGHAMFSFMLFWVGFILSTFVVRIYDKRSKKDKKNDKKKTLHK